MQKILSTFTERLPALSCMRFNSMVIHPNLWRCAPSAHVFLKVTACLFIQGVSRDTWYDNDASTGGISIDPNSLRSTYLPGWLYASGRALLPTFESRHTGVVPGASTKPSIEQKGGGSYVCFRQRVSCKLNLWRFLAQPPQHYHTCSKAVASTRTI